MWIRWCLLFSKRQHGKFPGKVHIPGAALESTFHCNPSLPLGLEFTPAKRQLSKAASPGGSHQHRAGGEGGRWGGAQDKEPSFELGRQDNGGHFRNLPFPVSKALKSTNSAKRCDFGANRQDLETALTFWHCQSKKSCDESGERSAVSFSSRGSQIPKSSVASCLLKTSTFHRNLIRCKIKIIHNPLESRARFQVPHYAKLQ